MLGKIYLRDEAGVKTDITEGVQVLYDLVISSMDWGSGFLTMEDALPVAQLAKACGFGKWQEAEKYIRSLEIDDEYARRLDDLEKQYPRISIGNGASVHSDEYTKAAQLIYEAKWKYKYALADFYKRET